MALILSIETATTTCSTALHRDGELLAERSVHQDRSHSKVLNELMLQVLQEADEPLSKIDAIAVSKGPGSYTGLRIGVATAKGVCFANDIPLIALNTLQIMTASIDVSKYTEDILLCPMIDARRMEVYTNYYDTQLQPLGETRAFIVEEGSFKSKLSEKEIVFFGNGMNKCKSLLDRQGIHFEEGVEPLASNMGFIAYEKFKAKDFEDLAYFEPFYLKDFRITPAKK